MRKLIFCAFLLLFGAVCMKNVSADYDKNIDLKLEDFICEHQVSEPECKKSKYRTMDGSCNNKRNPMWGTPFSKLARLFKPQYHDGVSSFQKALNGRNLPNPRLLSSTLFANQSVLEKEYTILNMQFGQVMAHDMSFGLGGRSKSCCIHGHINKKKAKHCDAIKIPKNDSVYSQVGWNCMDFTRDVHNQDLWCTAEDNHRPVHQISTATTYLDLSLVYGDNNDRAFLLRSYKRGLMEVDIRNGLEWPPHDPDAERNCFLDSPSDPCYLSSDDRINQNPGLAIIQIHYLREHNRLARALAKINPHWNDERLFQEARRINIAQYQFISYYEWLPIFLHEKHMLKNKLIFRVNATEYVNDYVPDTRSVVYEEHTNAVYRFFHSQIEGSLQLMNEARNVTRVLNLSDLFKKPKYVEKYFDELDRGMITQNQQRSDTNVDSEVTNKLFKNKRFLGEDLKAIDIQRARDHGLPFYNDVREFCGLKRAKKWDDYLDFISKESVDQLKKLYDHVDDVELSVGSALEKISEEDVQSGPTVLCILNIQFLNTRITDRYWFESGDPEVRFNPDQLAEIRKSSYSRLVCDNSPNIKTIQKESFKIVEDKNPIVKCSEIPSVDLTKWKEVRRVAH